MKTLKNFKPIKPLNSPTALAFSAVYNTVRYAMRFIKLCWLYIFA